MNIRHRKIFADRRSAQNLFFVYHSKWLKFGILIENVKSRHFAEGKFSKMHRKLVTTVKKTGKRGVAVKSNSSSNI